MTIDVNHNDANADSAGQPVAVEAVDLMQGQARPARVKLAMLLGALGMFALVNGASHITGPLIGLLLLGTFLLSGHTGWLFLFCGSTVGIQLTISDWQTVGQLLSLPEISQVIVVFLILVAGFRYADLKKYNVSFRIDKQLKLRQQATGSQVGVPFWVGLVRRQWLITVLALFSAFALINLLPADDSYLYDYWLKPRPGRLIILILVLFLGWFVCRLAIGLLDLWSLTPEKADIAFRSWYNREMWNEMAGVDKRRSRDNNR